VSLRHAQTVRAELVEALSCLAAVEEGQGFDTLSPNGALRRLPVRTSYV
jgi:hypothetical protein